MASGFNSVWAIDAGNNSLKALRLTYVGNTVEVIGFDNIQHGKILTGTGVKAEERDELIALTLRQFVEQNDLGDDDVVISVPSQNSFARFVSLPPVDAKRIPEIVQFEAAQQIPFDINDVQWDWQLMTEGRSTERKVGIFAIKNDVIDAALEHFSRENIVVGYVQMAPMALYNYILHDRPDLLRSESEATVILNIGAETTDLVVCTKSTVWQRCIPMGGNGFTRAIAETFKLNFEKAEKLKRTAPMSKYARQILQAMKPVFMDLASEIQRSLGFYTSSSKGVKLARIVALGGGTKMRGLLKYLQQTLQIPIERPDSFKRLTIGPDISAAKFHESVFDFGVVYGLGLQGLGLGRIESNLLPSSVARSMAWAAKSRYFLAAALMLLMVAILGFVRQYADGLNYDGKRMVRDGIRRTATAVQSAIDQLETQRSKGPVSEAIIKKEFGFFKHRDLIPLLHETVIGALPNEQNCSEEKQKSLHEAFARRDVEALMKVPREERKQIFITSMSVYYADDVEVARFGEVSLQKGATRRIGVRGSADSEIKAYLRSIGVEEEEFARPTYQTETPGTEGFGEKEAAAGPGFVVSITGYSPYRNIGELLDPVGAGEDRNRWGLVTRLLNLGSEDPNSPFRLYGKTVSDHFRMPTGEVDLEKDIPAGIGIEEIRFDNTKGATGRLTGERILVDPMTKEIICKVPELTEDGTEKKDRSGKTVYQVNDHWFRLDMKFVWKDAPKEETAYEE